MATDVLRTMVLGTEYEAPQGAISINETSNHADLWTRIGRVNRCGQFDVVLQSQDVVPADPYMIGAGWGLAAGLT